jgi:opacity protein-like surface antigen
LLRDSGPKEPNVNRLFGAALAPFLVLFLSVFAANADDERLYGTLSMGVSVPEVSVAGISSDTGANGDFGAAFGVQSSETFRWDVAEIRYVNFAGTDLGFGTSRSALSLGTTMNWGYFAKSGFFQPFVSLGLGAERLRYQNSADNALKNDWAFQWSFGGGISFDVSDKVRTAIRYRYTNTNRSAEGVDFSVNTNVVTLEITYMGGP